MSTAEVMTSCLQEEENRSPYKCDRSKPHGVCVKEAQIKSMTKGVMNVNNKNRSDRKTEGTQKKTAYFF